MKYKYQIQKLIGIYQIRNNLNNKRYVGQSVNIYNRWSSHIADLIADKHLNKELQKDFNEYGISFFEFSILELIEIESKDKSQNKKILKLIEQKYIDSLDLTFDYNQYNVIPKPKYIPKEEIIIPRSKIKKGIINTRKLIEIFGSQKNKDYYEKHNRIGTSVRNTLFNKALRYCDITYLGNGKYQIDKIYMKPKPKTRKKQENK